MLSRVTKYVGANKAANWPQSKPHLGMKRAKFIILKTFKLNQHFGYIADWLFVSRLKTFDVSLQPRAGMDTNEKVKTNVVQISHVRSWFPSSAVKL